MLRIIVNYNCCEYQKAELLGFKTHSAFVLDMRMAKTPERVESFLSDLQKRLQTLKQQELELFLTYKKEDVSSFIFNGYLNCNL